MPRTAPRRSWLVRYRWPLALTLVAVAVRLVWTLWVHPPGAYAYSDMLAYLTRATRLAGDPWGGPWPDEPFFPWGTHYLLSALLTLTGGTSPVTVGALWGAGSAAIAPLAYFMAGRLHGGPSWSAEEHGAERPVDDPEDLDETQAMTRAVARVSGALMVIYYPALSYAGLFLSESPFMVLLTAAALLALKLADHGRGRDALLLGIAGALGFAVRPQILAAFGMLFVFVLWRRCLFPALRWWHAPVVFAPIAAMLLFSAQLSYRHTRRMRPLPHSGALNRVFGRCHNYELVAADAMFGPPAFGALKRNELKDPKALFKLRPAIAGRLQVEHSVRNEAALNRLADRCVAASGQALQAYYAVTHVVLLWGYHVAWPDMGKKPFRFHMRGWTRAHLIVFALPAFIAMAMGASRRWPRHGIVGMFIWSMLASAMLFMGAARFRVPYDVISIVLGLDVYGRGAVWLTRSWRGWRPPPSSD